MIQEIPYFCMDSHIINKFSFPNQVAFLSGFRLYLNSMVGEGAIKKENLFQTGGYECYNLSIVT